MLALLQAPVFCKSLSTFANHVSHYPFSCTESSKQPTLEGITKSQEVGDGMPTRVGGANRSLTEMANLAIGDSVRRVTEKYYQLSVELMMYCTLHILTYGA